ncbi:MAG: hypothetical protein IPO65_16480 [Saprospiraceae bacterium]|nr:hypothetical protein [Saprospiraceae bacterium]
MFPNLAALVIDEADTCGTAIVTQSTAVGTPVNITDGQVIAYTVTVTDGAGNTATCPVNVTYEDDDLPTFTCPTPQTVFTNGNVNCEANVPNLAALVADEADNCGTAIVTQSTAADTS